VIRGLLLAGGASSRFGAPKLLHPFEGGPCIGEVSARNLLAGVGNALAVVRDGDEALARRLRGAGCEVLVTARARGGMGESIAAGVEAARDAQGWVIALADMPRVSAALSRSVAEALRGGAMIAAPVLPGGERGHPVGFSAALGDELCALSGDAGAKAMLARHRDGLVAVPTTDRGALYDVDSLADLQKSEPQTNTDKSR
jgi:molybdenum cofactor cytidylyltransferase